MRNPDKVRWRLEKAQEHLKIVSECLRIPANKKIIVMSKSTSWRLVHITMALCATFHHLSDALELLNKKNWAGWDKSFNSIYMDVKYAVSYLESLDRLEPPLPEKIRKDLEEALRLCKESKALLRTVPLSHVSAKKQTT